MALQDFTRNGTKYKVGDVAYLDSGTHDRPWIGEIHEIVSERSRKLHVVVRWFMRPVDVTVKGEGALAQFHTRELLQSTLREQNPVEVFCGLCTVHRINPGQGVPNLGANEWICRFLYDVEDCCLYRRVYGPVSAPVYAHVDPNTNRRKRFRSSSGDEATVKLLANWFSATLNMSPVPGCAWTGHELFYQCVSRWLFSLFGQRQGDLQVALDIIRGQRHTRKMPNPLRWGECDFCGAPRVVVVQRVQDGSQGYCKDCMGVLLDLRALRHYLDVSREDRKRYHYDTEEFQREFIEGFLRKWRALASNMG